MKIKTIFFLFLWSITLVSFTQDFESIEKPLPNNGVYIEIGGNGGNLTYIDLLRVSTSFTINYERSCKQNNKWLYRVGVGYSKASNVNYYSIPVEVSYLFRDSPHHIELGLGLSRLGKFNKKHYSTIVIFSRIGYRYSGVNGLLLRIALTPLYDHSYYFYGTGFFPSLGLSIGYSF